MKRFQNKAAESRSTLPIAALYGVVVWILAGLIQQQWWIQAVSYVIATFIIIELNNSNALIRIYSRMVSAAFIFLSCAACFLFPSLPGAVFQLCIMASLYTLFKCYQDKTTTGLAFYTFMLLGLGSLAHVQAFYLAPVYWLLMAITIYSLSWRTFSASLLGLMLPYWFYTTWVIFLNDCDFTPLASHLEQLGHYTFPGNYLALTLSQVLVFALVTILSVTGMVHYFRTSSRDNIRIRQLFYSLIILNIFSTLLLIVQPQHYDTMMRVMIITASPLIGHFISLTRTRVTNIVFFVIITITVLLTAFNLWMLL